jgi:hypothetical protein
MINFYCEVSSELWTTLLAAVEKSDLSFNEFLTMTLLDYLEDCDD